MRRALPLALGLVAADVPPDPCPTVPPYGYALEVGNARGRNEAEALAAARAAAKEALAAEVCRGVSDLRCTSIRKNIRPWGDGRYDRKAQSACAAVAVKRELIDSFEADAAKLAADVAALAPALARHAGRLPLAIAPPSWASGCVAGDVGASLVATLRTALGAFPDVRLVAAGDADPKAATARVTLAPGRDVVRVDVAVRQPGQSSEIPVGGFEFPIDLFALSADEVGLCRTDAALGFSGHRIGADGLLVDVEVPTVDGRICEGASFHPVVRTDRTAPVEVWSVAQDGTAYLIFPAPGAPDRVSGERDLGATQAVRLAGYAGDESLVAVAGGTGGRSALCRLAAAFSPDAVAPGTAALARTTYTVIPAGTEGCPPWAGEARAQLEQVLATAPVCR